MAEFLCEVCQLWTPQTGNDVVCVSCLEAERRRATTMDSIVPEIDKNVRWGFLPPKDAATNTTGIGPSQEDEKQRVARTDAVGNPLFPSNANVPRRAEDIPAEGRLAVTFSEIRARNQCDCCREYEKNLRVVLSARHPRTKMCGECFEGYRKSPEKEALYHHDGHWREMDGVIFDGERTFQMDIFSPGEGVKVECQTVKEGDEIRSPDGTLLGHATRCYVQINSPVLKTDKDVYPNKDYITSAEGGGPKVYFKTEGKPQKPDLADVRNDNLPPKVIEELLADYLRRVGYKVVKHGVI